jgi:hypothetical protein
MRKQGNRTPQTLATPSVSFAAINEHTHIPHFSRNSHLNHAMLSDGPMASSRTPAISAILLPSIGNMVFVAVLFVLVFNSGQGLLGDGDTGYHIRTGEVILRTWNVPKQDIYSLHVPPLKWTAHEWMAEIIMAVIFRFVGLTGIVVFFAFLLAMTHWLLYRILRSKSQDILLCTCIAMLATATSSTHWLARPHSFSLLLAVIWCHCLDRFQYNNDRTLMYLPLLMLFWVNLHGGYFIGLVLLAIYLTGNVVYSISGRPDQLQRYRVKAKALFLVLIATVVICAVNPSGFEILWFPIRVTSDRFVMDHVTEFMSPNFHDVLPFKYMLLAAIGMLALSRSPLNLIEVAVITLLSYMALYSGRHVSLFAIVTAPLLLRTAASIIDRMPRTFLRYYRNRNLNLNAIDTRLQGYFWPVIAVLFVSGLILTGTLKYQFDDKKFPVAAVEFLKKETVTGNMFNNDEFGDYMIFAAWPMYRVFMDGRSDMYGEKLGSAYLKVANVQPGWKEILGKYDISWIIFDTYSALTAALRDQRDWQPIYSDRVATIFVKKDAAHERLLARYPAVTLSYER